MCEICETKIDNGIVGGFLKEHGVEEVDELEDKDSDELLDKLIKYKKAKEEKTNATT